MCVDREDECDNTFRRMQSSYVDGLESGSQERMGRAWSEAWYNELTKIWQHWHRQFVISQAIAVSALSWVAQYVRDFIRLALFVERVKVR
jgi:hypothetical protein